MYLRIQFVETEFCVIFPLTIMKQQYLYTKNVFHLQFSNNFCLADIFRTHQASSGFKIIVLVGSCVISLFYEILPCTRFSFVNKALE